MSWNMGEREAVRAWLAGIGDEHKADAAASALVADALLRAVGRQAIIAAAADAVAALGCRGDVKFEGLGTVTNTVSTGPKPGGGQGDGSPMDPPNP